MPKTLVNGDQILPDMPDYTVERLLGEGWTIKDDAVTAAPSDVAADQPPKPRRRGIGANTEETPE